MPSNRHHLKFEDLKFRKYTLSCLIPKHNHPIAAIDTETYQGYPKLIGDSFGNYKLNSDIDGILSFLTHNRFRKTHIFCYNLQYDGESILKMLPDKNVLELIEQNSTNYKKYRIKYIPKKLLTIRDEHRNTSRLFDLAQFFETTLDNALKTSLKVSKTDFPYRSALNTDISVWDTMEAEIIDYNLDDAKKTALLGEFLQNNIKTLFDYNPQAYISKAGLTKELIRIKGYLPNITKIPKEALKFAFYAYKGGRFEIVQRGYFDYVELYDLNSAYSFVIQNLIDVTAGEWRKTTELNPDAYYGFYLCDVFVLPAHICPVAYILPNKTLCFPVAKFRTYLTKNEIIAYRPYADINIIRGWEFYPFDLLYPFKNYVLSLYEQKQKFTEDTPLYELVKKMMNSVYGCFYEKYPHAFYLMTGKMFNPVYAATITADTRIKLFTEAIKHGNKNIAMATDSLLLQGKNHLETSSALGGWSLKTTGDAIVVQSGVYKIAGKIKSRSMTRTKKVIYNNTEYDDVFEMIRLNPDQTKYLTFQERPLHLKECIIRSKEYTKEDVNVWHFVQRTIDVNKDIKRKWLGQFQRGEEIFERNIQSQAWKFYS